MSRDTHVYFMRPVGQQGPIKIGCSKEPRQRLESLSIWSPVPLEIICYVKGSYSDEYFLHSGFHKSLSHREWFHWSQRLEDTIARIREAGSLAGLRDILGSERPKRTIKHEIPPHMRKQQHYRMRIWWVEKKLRASRGCEGAWHIPQDVFSIVNTWGARVRKGGNGKEPTASEMARLEEFLRNPEDHCVVPSWVKDRQEEAAA